MIKAINKSRRRDNASTMAIKKVKVKQMIEKLPIAKPAYNTVSTIVRILEIKDS